VRGGGCCGGGFRQRLAAFLPEWFIVAVVIVLFVLFAGMAFLIVKTAFFS